MENVKITMIKTNSKMHDNVYLFVLASNGKN